MSSCYYYCNGLALGNKSLVFVLNNEWVAKEEFIFFVLLGLLFEICGAKDFAFWQILVTAYLFPLCFDSFYKLYKSFLIIKFSTNKVG
jgi:hypothetical protein